MLSMRRHLRRVSRDERGFTLVETLVAIVTGLIVIAALFAILEVSLHQTARVVDVVQATQTGRTTMTKVVDELQSACLAPAFRPIQKGSTESKLIFINAYSNKAMIPAASENASEGAYEHEITWENSKLVDRAYPSTGGAWPNFTFSLTPKTTTIGSNITQTQTETKPATAVPIFQYYAYAPESSSLSDSENALSTISSTPLSASVGSGLSATDAEKAASVLISFRNASVDNNSALNRSIDLSNRVTLAFSAPASEASIEAGPCE